MPPRFPAATTLLLLCLLPAQALSQQPVPQQPNQPPAAPMDLAQVRHLVAARGLNKGMQVTETDGLTVRGIITAIGPDSFDLLPPTILSPVTIPFASVAALHNTPGITRRTERRIQGTMAVTAVILAVPLFVLAAVVIFRH